MRQVFTSLAFLLSLISALSLHAQFSQNVPVVLSGGFSAVRNFYDPDNLRNQPDYAKDTLINNGVMTEQLWQFMGRLFDPAKVFVRDHSGPQRPYDNKLKSYIAYYQGCWPVSKKENGQPVYHALVWIPRKGNKRMSGNFAVENEYGFFLVYLKSALHFPEGEKRPQLPSAIR